MPGAGQPSALWALAYLCQRVTVSTFILRFHFNDMFEFAPQLREEDRPKNVVPVQYDLRQDGYRCPQVLMMEE